MRRNRSCTSFCTRPWIDRAPVTALDPIAFRAVVARSEGQGRRPIFREADKPSRIARLENVCRQRSLALDGSEHDGWLTSVQDGGPCAAVAALVVLLIAGTMIVTMPCPSMADPLATETQTTRTATTVASSDPWADHIAEAVHRFAIPERWIRAVMRAESDHVPRAISPKGAIGLMQIMPATWEELRIRHDLGDDPYDPRDNILAGAAYLAELYNRYGSPGFLAAYNAGPGRYEKHLVTGEPLPAETRAYVAKIAPPIRAYTSSALHKTDRPARAEWFDAPLFIGRLALPSGDKQAVKHPPSVRPPSDSMITDLSALAPLSDALFISRSGTEVAE